MKIKDIRAVPIDVSPKQTTEPRVPKLPTDGFISPMERYPEFKKSEWTASWKRAACVVTTEDGTWGFGLTINGGPVISIINDHFAPLLEGQNCMATEKLWDMMRRAPPTGTTAPIIDATMARLSLSQYCCHYSDSNICY